MENLEDDPEKPSWTESIPWWGWLLIGIGIMILINITLNLVIYFVNKKKFIRAPALSAEGWNP